MKVVYLGADHRKGVSTKSGKAYDIAEVTYAIPAEPKETSDYVYRAVGYQVRTIPLDPSYLSRFSDVKPFAPCDLVLEPDPRNPSRNRVVGVK